MDDAITRCCCFAVQTGFRVSEVISLDRDAIHLGRGAHDQRLALITSATCGGVIMRDGSARQPEARSCAALAVGMLTALLGVPVFL